MFIWNVKLTRKRAVLWVVLAGVAVALVILAAGTWGGQREDAPNGIPVEDVTDNAARVAFLTAYGWSVSPEPVETLRLLLPETLDKDWTAYNVLQKQQGFDLEDYRGKRVERFTYQVTNYPGTTEDVQINLYLFDGRVIGGDVFCAGEQGFQDTLAFPKAAE